MATLTWVGGGNNRASNPNDWSPAQVPMPGDVLMMPMGGTMYIADRELAGNTLEIASPEPFTPGGITTSLSLSHHAQVSIDQPGISGVYSATTISVSGQDTLSVNSAFPLAFNSSQSYVVNLAPDARLTASFDLNYSTITINRAGGAKLVNDGSATLAGSQMTINADVLGVGSFQVSALAAPLVPDTGYLEFGDTVSSGETVTIGNPTIAEDGIDWDELKIDQPREFHGTVVLQPNAFVELAGLAASDSYSYSNDILSIWSGRHVIDTLRLTNQSGGDLVVATDANGDVFVEPSGPSPLQENLTLTPLPLHEPSYTVTTLTTPGATDPVPNAVNDRGEVVGRYLDSSGYHGFVYYDGTFTPIDGPGATITSAEAINNRGEIAGAYSTIDSGSHAFVYDNGTLTPLDPPGGNSNAEAINNRGEVVGGFVDSSGEGHGFVYDDGTYTTLSVPGATETLATGINDRGEVAGVYNDSSPGLHGFVYENGSYTLLNTPGAVVTGVSAINDRGEVTGSYQDSSGVTHGFIDDDGIFTTLSAPGASSTDAVAVNDSGEIAGSYVDSSGISHGFVYDDGTYTTLNGPGATNTFVTAINNRGDVVGNYEDSNGEHDFLASPEGGEANAARSGFGEVLSAHARYGGVNDLLPNIPGITGSPSSADASGMLDQAPAVGGRFASFGGWAGDQTQTQALLHASGTSLGTG
jgi:probable HAF family extracellular repeat protein